MTDSTSKTLRVGLVGAGGMGNVWAQTIAADPNCELAAIVDPLYGSERQSAWLANFADVPGCTTLAAAAPELDAIMITAHSTVHAEIIREGLSAGLHVLVEKPFALTLAECEELVDLAARHQRNLMVSQNYRFFPGAVMIRDLVRAKRWGNVVAVFGEFWCDWPGKPYQHAMQHVMGLEMAVHHFDLCRAMFDADAAGGHVREWQPAGSQYAAGGAMECLFDMRGDDRDFPFTYSGSLVGRAPKTPWGGHWRIELDQATLVVDTIDGRYGVYRASEEGFEYLSSVDGESMGFNRPFEHFVASIQNGTEPWSSGRDNLGTMRMVLGAEVFGRK